MLQHLGEKLTQLIVIALGSLEIAFYTIVLEREDDLSDSV
jgi:hypothetical protein